MVVVAVLLRVLKDKSSKYFGCELRFSALLKGNKINEGGKSPVVHSLET